MKNLLNIKSGIAENNNTKTVNETGEKTGEKYDIINPKNKNIQHVDPDNSKIKNLFESLV